MHIFQLPELLIPDFNRSEDIFQAVVDEIVSEERPVYLKTAHNKRLTIY